MTDLRLTFQVFWGKNVTIIKAADKQAALDVAHATHGPGLYFAKQIKPEWMRWAKLSRNAKRKGQGA